MAERRIGSRRTTPQPAPEAGPVAASQSPLRPTIRATRSQSRDVGDSEDGRKGAKAPRSTKQTGSAAGQSNRKGRGGRPAKGSRVLQDLPTVTEDPSVVYPDIRSREDDDAGQVGVEETFDQPTAQPSKSPGGASAFSGTTARTSLSDRALSDLSSEEMLDALPDLADASSKILGFLVPRQITGASVAGIASQLQTKDSRENKNLRRLGSTFQVQRDVYGSESYINPRGILRVFLGSKGILGHDAERWRPDALLQKANLAVLTSNILSHSVQAQNDQLIEDLEQAFPISFVEGFVQSETPTPGSSALARETLQLALETRTQYAILSLARYAGQRNFDFDDVLHQVFYKNQTNLKGWAILGLRAEDLTHDVHDAILHRLKELRNAFAASPQNPTAGIKTLKEDYPWAIFVLQTIDWIGQRLSEIEMQIELHGGAETIHQSLSNEIQRRRFVDSTIDDAGDDVSSPLELIFEPPSETSLTTSDQRDIALLPARTTELQVSHFSRNSPKAMNVMKNLKIRLANPKAPSPAQQNLVQPAQQPSLTIQVASTAGPSTSTLPVQMQAEEPAIPTSAPAQVLNDQQGPLQQEDDWRHQEDEDIFPAAVPIVIEASAAEDPYATRVLALKEKSDAESNKENVAEASQPIVQSHHGQRRLIDRQPNAQRIVFESQDSHASSQVSDVNSDVSFEHMHATADTAQKRSSKPAMKRSATEPARTQGRSPKKGRVEELSGSRSQAPARNREIDRPGPSRTQALVQIRDEDRPIPSQMDEYKAANAAAKEKTAFQIKPTQTRKPWSDDETSRLHELIVKYGVSWKLLEQEDKNRIGGPLLVNRDQTALKDKARNMKMDYLKASRHLPENFFRIPINENMITRLKSENITYDRETGQREDALLEDD